MTLEDKNGLVPILSVQKQSAECKCRFATKKNTSVQIHATSLNAIYLQCIGGGKKNSLYIYVATI